MGYQECRTTACCKRGIIMKNGMSIEDYYDYVGSLMYQAIYDDDWINYVFYKDNTNETLTIQ